MTITRRNLLGRVILGGLAASGLAAGLLAGPATADDGTIKIGAPFNLTTGNDVYYVAISRARQKLED